MRLKSLELKLEWPENIPIQGLRRYVLEELRDSGEPIRWAITSIVFSPKSQWRRELTVEAVVIIT